MKPINEIRFILCAINIFIMISTGDIQFFSGVEGFLYVGTLIFTGCILGCWMTSLLVAFKKWWRE